VIRDDQDMMLYMTIAVDDDDSVRRPGRAQKQISFHTISNTVVLAQGKQITMHLKASSPSYAVSKLIAFDSTSTSLPLRYKLEIVLDCTK
jgi:hypothetical protein